VRHSVSAPSQKAAESKLRALQKAKHQGPTGSRKNLEWLAQEWLASKSNREANTLSGYETKLRDWIVPKLGHVTLKHLDTPEAQTTVQRFLNECAKQLAPKSIKHLRDTVCNILNWAAKLERGYLSRNWLTGVEALVDRFARTQLLLKNAMPLASGMNPMSERALAVIYRNYL
jgi:hypothetical protein